LTGAQLLIRALKTKGIKYIFGYTGGAIMPVFDELLKEKGIKVIRPRHEQGGAFMAQGLSRASVLNEKSLVGVCMSTSGPGAMNMVTGVADAYMDSVPLLAISGQVTTRAIGTDAFQESDVIGVMMPVTRQTYMPMKPDEVERMVHEAFYVATTGRGGPVSIDIPKDSQIDQVKSEYKFLSNNYKPELPGFNYQPKPRKSDIQRVLTLLEKSKKPLIIAGRGIINAKAHNDLLKFSGLNNIPVTLTMHGLSAIPADYKLNLGMAGMHGTAEANQALDRCDLLISIGMRFDDRITGKPDNFASRARKIHVDIDPSEINKNVNVDCGVVADSLEFLKALNQQKINKVDRSDWFNLLSKFNTRADKEENEEIDKGIGPNKRLLLKRVIADLSEITKGKDIIVSDVGQHEMIAARYYNFQMPNSWFASGGAGTMGCALPMSIGVKIARPNERVWCVVGDGSFQMNIQELGTLKQYGFDIKIILSSNNTLGMVRQWQTLFFDKRYTETGMNFMNVGKVADAYDIPYLKIDKKYDIRGAINKATKYDGPMILDFITDPDELVLPMIPSGGNATNMITSFNMKKEND
jgi:acetolactate synthase-1/2/3 large subunit